MESREWGVVEGNYGSDRSTSLVDFGQTIELRISRVENSHAVVYCYSVIFLEERSAFRSLSSLEVREEVGSFLRVE